MNLVRRGALTAASLALAATLTACTGESGGSAAQPAEKGGQEASQKTESRSALQVMTAATRKTAEAKSAKVSTTMTIPGKGGGTVEMSGVMGWDPYAMDVTMSGGMFAKSPDAPEEIRMIFLDNAMYMDMGEKAAAEMDGKRWMKLDLAAAAEASGNPAAAMTPGAAQGMRQSPAQQVGLLLDSPNMKFLGEEQLDGVATRHYKGSLTIEEMMKANNSAEVLDGKQREKLVKQFEESGVEDYDIEVWLNEGDMPVRINVAMDTPSGTVTTSQRLSDFGTDVSVQAPPAGETVDVFKMLQQAGKGAGAGSTA